MNRVRVLFVCLGNICRSPMAQGVLEYQASKRGLSGRIEVDSAGVAPWNEGNPPDPRAQAEMLRHGIDIGSQQARQVSARDFFAFDYIIAMDDTVYDALAEFCPAERRGRVRRCVSFAPDASAAEVCDPFHGQEDGFADTFELIAACIEGLIDEIERRSAHC